MKKKEKGFVHMKSKGAESHVYQHIINAIGITNRSNNQLNVFKDIQNMTSQ